jgi:phage-related protein
MKDLLWLGSSKRDLLTFPEEVIDEVGHALYEVQIGRKPASAKPFKGFGGASVLEIVEDFDKDTYRAVYAVEFEEAVYVLHCFKKKSKSGISTPKQDVDLIEQRYKKAEEEHREWRRKQSLKKSKGKR